MPAHVQGRRMHLPAQRLEDGFVGDGVEACRMQEQHIDRPHGIAERDAGRLTILQLYPKPAHAARLASEHFTQKVAGPLHGIASNRLLFTGEVIEQSVERASRRLIGQPRFGVCFHQTRPVFGHHRINGVQRAGGRQRLVEVRPERLPQARFGLLAEEIRRRRIAAAQDRPWRPRRS